MSPFYLFPLVVLLGSCAGAPSSTTPNPKANVMIVSDSTQLKKALLKVAPGDMITLADGVYVGPFVATANGTSDDPILMTAKEQRSRNLTIIGIGDKPALSVKGKNWNLNHLKFEGTIGLHVTGKDFWGEDIVVQNCDTGIVLKGEDGTLRKSYVVDATHVGIQVEGDKAFVEKNTIVRSDLSIVVAEEACCGHLKENVCDGEVQVNGKKYVEESTKHIKK